MSEKILDVHKKHALTDAEVVKLVKGKARVVPYNELHEYKNIDELLKPYGAVFILYQRKPNFGHWVALFKRQDRQGNAEIEYYDPLGYFIDDPLKWTSKEMQKQLNMDYPYLTELMYKAPHHYNLIYNQYPFQKQGKDINTCGRYCVLRLLNRNKTLDQFKKSFEENSGVGINSKQTDDFVTEETMFEI